MTPMVRIRPMTRAALDRVTDIARSLSYAPHWPPKVYQGALDPAHRPQRIALVAENPGGLVAGFAIASLIPPQAELESIAVAPEAQRKGIALDLFRVLSTYLQAAKVTEVILEVRASNLPALALYRRLGFAQSGRRPRYYADPEEDAILLSRPLESAGLLSEEGKGSPDA